MSGYPHLLSPRRVGTLELKPTLPDGDGSKGRWTECDSHPLPNACRVKLRDLRDRLPAGVAMVTPEERQAILAA